MSIFVWLPAALNLIFMVSLLLSCTIIVQENIDALVLLYISSSENEDEKKVPAVRKLCAVWSGVWSDNNALTLHIFYECIETIFIK